MDSQQFPGRTELLVGQGQGLPWRRFNMKNLGATCGPRPQTIWTSDTIFVDRYSLDLTNIAYNVWHTYIYILHIYITYIYYIYIYILHIYIYHMILYVTYIYIYIYRNQPRSFFSTRALPSLAPLHPRSPPQWALALAQGRPCDAPGAACGKHLWKHLWKNYVYIYNDILCIYIYVFFYDHVETSMNMCQAMSSCILGHFRNDHRSQWILVGDSLAASAETSWSAGPPRWIIGDRRQRWFNTPF